MKNLKEDKELLLKDLCARLPYGVRMFEIEPINNIQSNLTLYSITNKASVICITPSGGAIGSSIDAFKPYLFPISSMTEEQYENFLLTNSEITLKGVICSTRGFDFLNKHHFDYRGLIKKGLAIDATGLNIY